eukprot:TRINITY_DN288_c0_g1_i1.p1 TRINITY_DN288_c0_g1~~TRINITY_DN288_c0_g1_i1.p1  ORF type:complete len:196 (-),score=24.28 TRINITY_DN288_c0_g1_i1:55-642(-)
MFGAALLNDGTKNISSLNIRFVAEILRYGNQYAAPLRTQYRFLARDSYNFREECLTQEGYIDIEDLVYGANLKNESFLCPETPENKRTLSGTIQEVDWAPRSVLCVRWLKLYNGQRIDSIISVRGVEVLVPHNKPSNHFSLTSWVVLLCVVFAVVLVSTTLIVALYRSRFSQPKSRASIPVTDSSEDDQLVFSEF